MDRVADDFLNQGRLADRAIDDIMTAGLAGDFRQTDFVEQLADRRHFGDEALLHQAALLAACVGIQFVVETDRRELLLAEPGLKGHV